MRKLPQDKAPARRGGAGGDASVQGDGSEAVGGDAGDAVVGPGGRGGSARVVGKNSRAEGGRGGRGGLGQGGPGGDVEALTDNTLIAGGDGGESNQADGRGGRGGLPHPITFEALGIPRHDMRLPYWAPNFIPGRGGDGGSTPQYTARRLIIEELKLRYFAMNGLPLDRMAVWFDRGVVPMEWLNERLRADDHRWTALVVDQEYEFNDLEL